MYVYLCIYTYIPVSKAIANDTDRDRKEPHRNDAHDSCVFSCVCVREREVTNGCAVCLYMYIYVHTYIYTYIHICIYIHTYIHIHVYICIYDSCVFERVGACVRAFTNGHAIYTCIHAYIQIYKIYKCIRPAYVHTYIHTYIYTHTHTHTHTYPHLNTRTAHKATSYSAMRKRHFALKVEKYVPHDITGIQHIYIHPIFNTYTYTPYIHPPQHTHHTQSDLRK